MRTVVFGLLVVALAVVPYFLGNPKSYDSDEDVLISNFNMPRASLSDEFQTDDIAVYVVKNTFVNRTQDKDHRQFSVDVKTLSGMILFREKYSFRESDGLVYCSVDGEEEKVFLEDTLPDKIWKYGLNYLGID